jgi:hypothetical protein
VGPNIVPENYDYFDVVALELIEKEKGSVICRKCDKTYPAAELKSIKVGHGRTPFEENAHEKSNGLKLRAIFSGNWIRVAVDNIKNPFRKRNSHVPMWGGVGYACPKDHELITLVIHQTLLFFETASSLG